MSAFQCVFLQNLLWQFMALLSNLTVLLLLACVSHQMMSGGHRRSHEQRGRGHKGHHGARYGSKAARQVNAVSAQRVKGKLVTKDKSVCTWTATGEDLVLLNVLCEKDGRSFSCEYSARPALCLHFTSNQELYWKQISRALKKHKKPCEDSNTLVKAAMCRRSPREAHFILHHVGAMKKDFPASAATAVSSCKSENKKLAEEFCIQSWSSFCTFLFTMIKDSDCWGGTIMNSRGILQFDFDRLIPFGEVSSLQTFPYILVDGCKMHLSSDWWGSFLYEIHVFIFWIPVNFLFIYFIFSANINLPMNE